MNSHRATFFTAVAVAGFSVSLVLTGCGPQPGTSAAASDVAVSNTAERTATRGFPTSSTPAPSATATGAGAGSAPASKVPASPKKQASPALKTFTFPDGHISFAYPETWRVRMVQPPAGLPGVEAIVADAEGNDLLTLANGVTAGCAGGPVSRQVFDQASVPAMTAPNGTEPSFGFVAESYGNGEAYFMGLTDPRSLKEGEGVSSWCNLIPTANGGLFTRVHFSDPGFPNRGAAKAWTATDQYAQLKALLLSLKYA